MSKEESIQTNFRGVDEAEGFSIISNAAWSDKALSVEARGMLISIVVLPKDWLFNRIWAMRELSIGRDKLDRILGELKAAGYLRYVRPRDEAGRLEGGYYLYAANPKSLAKAITCLEGNHHTPGNPTAGDDHTPEKPSAGFTSRGKTRTLQSNKRTYKKRNYTKSASRISNGISKKAEPAAPRSVSPKAEPVSGAEVMTPEQKAQRVKALREVASVTRALDISERKAQWPKRKS